MATHLLSKNVNDLRNKLNSALNNIQECWFGNMSKEMQTYIKSSLNEGISLETLESQLYKLDEILILKEDIKEELDVYAFTKYQLEELYTDSKEFAKKNLLMVEINNCNTNITDMLTTINSKNTEVSDLYKNALRYNTSKHTEKHDVYGLSLGKLLQASKYLDDVINGLLEIRTSLSTSNYSSVTLKAIYRMKIYKTVVVQAGVARNAILNTINWLTIQIKMIQAKIDNHIDNIMKYEKNQTITLGNVFGDPVSVSMSSNEPETKIVEETYTMKKGDTLIAVAAMYPGVTWQQIAKANNITDTRNIAVGQKLIIPGQTKTVKVSPEMPSSADSSNSSKVQTVTSAPISGLESLTTVDIGTASNWSSNAEALIAGQYNPPTVLNADGKMVDDNGDLIKNYGYEFGEKTKNGIHRGVDLSGGNYDEGTPIYPIGSGIVVDCKNDDKYNEGKGNYVVILHETYDENTGETSYIYSKYYHCSSLSKNIKVGTVVNDDTILGGMGDTGNSDGVHIHLEVTKVPDLTKEMLAGKSTEEVCDIVAEQGIDDNYGKTYWINPMKYYEEQGLI